MKESAWFRSALLTSGHMHVKCFLSMLYIYLCCKVLSCFEAYLAFSRWLFSKFAFYFTISNCRLVTVFALHNLYVAFQMKRDRKNSMSTNMWWLHNATINFTMASPNMFIFQMAIKFADSKYTPVRDSQIFCHVPPTTDFAKNTINA